MRLGVVIGSYGMPDMVRLNVAVLRKHAREVPILIADDASPQYEELAATARSFPDVALWPNAQRIGHRGGCLSVFWKGLVWARACGFDVVVKLSQRCILDVPDWPSTVEPDLGDAATLTEPNVRPPLGQTEISSPWRELRLLAIDYAIGLRVSAWATPEVLTHCTPRAIGDHLLFEAVLGQELVPMTGPTALWSIYDRRGFLFHPFVPAERYHALAEEHGVELTSHLRARSGEEGYMPG